MALGNSRIARRRELVGIAIAALILTVIFVPFQQATAFTVTVDLPGTTGGEIEASASGEPFEITIDVEAGELLSIDEITLILDNGDASVTRAVFNSAGDLTDGDTNLVVNDEVTISAFSNTGYGYGFGLVSGGVTGFSGNTYSFTSTNDFVGGNTLGYSNVAGGTNFVTGLIGPGTITISGTLETANLALGSHTFNALIDTGADGNNVDELVAPTFSFTVIAPEEEDAPSGGGGGGGGGGRTVIITWPPAETLPADHFINFPLDRIRVASSAFVNAAGISITNAQVNQQVSIAGEFTNLQGTEQNYAFIVQVTDENGFVTDIAWQQGTLDSGSTAALSVLWTPEDDGTYTVQIFVWNEISNTPEPLSEVTVRDIAVTG